MEERACHPGLIYEAWQQIHHALQEAISPLAPQTLAFFAERAADRIIRDAAAAALHSLEDVSGAEDGAPRSAEHLRWQYRQAESE